MDSKTVFGWRGKKTGDRELNLTETNEQHIINIKNIEIAPQMHCSIIVATYKHYDNTEIEHYGNTGIWKHGHMPLQTSFFIFMVVF